jgi:hypothetical protein
MKVRPLEYRDLDSVLALLEDMAHYNVIHGGKFFEPDVQARRNGFMETLVKILSIPEFYKESLLLVGDYQNQPAAVLMAHAMNNYPYARHKKGIYIAALWFKKGVPPAAAAGIMRHGLTHLRQFTEEQQATTFFGHTFHADMRARKLMQKIGLRASFIRYEGEV